MVHLLLLSLSGCSSRWVGRLRESHVREDAAELAYSARKFGPPFGDPPLVGGRVSRVGIYGRPYRSFRIASSRLVALIDGALGSKRTGLGIEYEFS